MSLPTKAKMSAAAAAALLTASFTANAASEGAGAPSAVLPTDVKIRYSPEVSDYLDGYGKEAIEETVGVLRRDEKNLSSVDAVLLGAGVSTDVLLTVTFSGCEVARLTTVEGETVETAFEFVDTGDVFNAVYDNIDKIQKEGCAGVDQPMVTASL